VRRPAVPAPPRTLSTASRQIWRTVHAKFELELDKVAILATVLQAADRRDAARAIVDRDGLVITVGKSTRAHYLLSVIKDCDQVILRGWRQLQFDVSPTGPMGRPPGRGPA
jgi:hypothetical protein